MEKLRRVLLDPANPRNVPFSKTAETYVVPPLLIFALMPRWSDVRQAADPSSSGAITSNSQPAPGEDTTCTM